MVRPKATSKQKQQKRGVDFKKIKRKIGRKLPPPKNSTNTEIKSKAIVLPEQSVASERVGLALSKKGLTLKELLQQTSHHNAKVRRDALIGIKDLVLKNPTELSLHKLAIIEKLRERISDDDKVVRENLYQLLKSAIFPGSKEETSGPFISLIMAYIFNAMTHLAFDIRLMAFKFFELVVQHYPSSFLSYAEKVLKNYEEILQNNHMFLQDKTKLKSALVGLVRCLSLLPSVERDLSSSYEKNTYSQGALHAFDAEVASKEHTDASSIVHKLQELMPVLVNCFQELTQTVLVMPMMDAQSFDCMLCVLQSIDLAVKFLIHGSTANKRLSFSLPNINEGPNISYWGETKLPMLLKKLLVVFPLSPMHQLTEKLEDKYYMLNVRVTEIFMHCNEWVGAPTISMETFLEFVENALSGQIFCGTRSNKPLREKHVASLIPFIPKLILHVESSWRYRLLQAFTEAFKGCKPDSSLKLTCISAIEEMLLPSNKESMNFTDTSDPDILSFQGIWTQELPVLLVQLGDKHPSSSKIVLHLQLRLAQHAPMNSSLAWEYNNMQHSLREFYCTSVDEGGISYGPFTKLPKDCQELAICSFYYFSSWDSLLLKSLACCCLCTDLELDLLFRIIEVLQSSYKAGHIHIAEYTSFLVTLLARFDVHPGKVDSSHKNIEKNSQIIAFKSITHRVCSCLYEMGDATIVLQMLEKIILYRLSLNPPLDNMCAMLRVLALLDSKPTRLPGESTSILGNSLLEYLIDVANYIPVDNHESIDSGQMHMCRYYLLPCLILFDKNDGLLNIVLNLMGSSIVDGESTFPSHHDAVDEFNQSRRITAVASVLLFMHRDVKIQRSLSSCTTEIGHILRNIESLQSSDNINLSLEERHKIKLAFDQLESLAV